MRVAQLFYAVGGLFALAAIAYFAFEYVVYASDVIKLLLLALLSVALFFFARYAEEGQ